MVIIIDIKKKLEKATTIPALDAGMHKLDHIWPFLLYFATLFYVSDFPRTEMRDINSVGLEAI